MKNCRNDILMANLEEESLDQQTEITIEVLDDLPDCRKIKARQYFDTVSDEQLYDELDRPQNVFECYPRGCKTTGTLTLTKEAGEGETDVRVSASYRDLDDSTEYAVGVITFYVKKADDEDIDVSFKISSVGDSSNADVYTQTVKGSAGFAPVVIDLSREPDEVVGDGWMPSESGAEITIDVPSGTGISTIAMFEDMEDFNTSNIVKIGCLSQVAKTIELAVETANCSEAGYDTSNLPEIDLEFTGTKITANTWKLNPMMKIGKHARGFRDKVVERVLAVPTGSDYAVAKLNDANEEVCGRYMAEMADECNAHDSLLYRLTLPDTVDIDRKHFLVRKAENGIGMEVLFNKELEGKKVKISYPQTIEVEERVADFDNVQKRRCNLSYPVFFSDGEEVIKHYDNVLITSIPDTVDNSKKAEFNFKVRLLRGANGTLFREERVLDTLS